MITSKKLRFFRLSNIAVRKLNSIYNNGLRKIFYNKFYQKLNEICDITFLAFKIDFGHLPGPLGVSLAGPGSALAPRSRSD